MERSVALDPRREQVGHTTLPFGDLEFHLHWELLAEVDGHLAVLR